VCTAEPRHGGALSGSPIPFSAQWLTDKDHQVLNAQLQNAVTQTPDPGPQVSTTATHVTTASTCAACAFQVNTSADAHTTAATCAACGQTQTTLPVLPDFAVTRIGGNQNPSAHSEGTYDVAVTNVRANSQSPVQVDVLRPQVAGLADAQAGLEKDLEDAVLARVRACVGQDARVLLRAEEGLACSFLLGRLERGRRRLADQLLVFQKTEVAADGGDLAGARHAGEAAIAERGQVLLQVPALHLVGARQRHVGLPEEVEALSDIGLIGADGRRGEVGAFEASKE
jgi:hypothetical protein